MNPQSEDLAKAFLGVLVTVFLVVSVFSAGMAQSSAETENEMEILVYKEGIDQEILEARQGYSVIENYDSFVLVETTKDKKLALERQGFDVEYLQNRDYVGLQSYSFHADEGEPEIPDNLEIEEYPNEGKGYYILQFMGPIKPEWQEELEDRGVILHQFKHRFNYIVEMDQQTRGEVEKLDFVEWTGIYQPAYRFDRDLLEKKEPAYVDISLFDGVNPKVIANGLADVDGEIRYIGQDRVSIEVDPDDIVNLAKMHGVKSIAEGNDEYRLFNSRATWVTQTNEQDNRKVTDKGVTGKGELITVMDSGLQKDHEAFADDQNQVGDNHRKVQARYVPEGGDGDVTAGQNHGTHVTGTVLGDSPDYENYTNQDGNALEARVIFQDVSTDGQSIGAPDNMYDNGYGDAYERGARIHTNSWGGRGSGEYSEFSQETDQFIWDHKNFNVLFAMGNSGSDNGTASPQASGKNVIGVGAMEGGAGESGGGGRGGLNGVNTLQEEQDNVASFSSRGYALDGRIKPDITHIGAGVMSADHEDNTGYKSLDGTSMACPGMAGQTGQVRDYYNSGWYPTGSPTDADSFEPSNALVRATLINGAVEATGNGSYLNDKRFPNNDQGFGRSKLDRAMHFQGDDRKLQVFDSLKEGENLSTGDTWSKSFYVEDPSQELEVTLAWTDYPGSAGADESNPAIVNDLDLELSGPSGTTYVGNAFTGYNPGYSEANPTDNFWSGQREGNEFDGLNVIEDILLLPDQNGVEGGNYEVTVTGHNVPEGPQPFALVVSGGVESANPPSIDITRPSGGEEWASGTTETIEWTTTPGDAAIDSVDLEYSTDDGASWNVISTGLADTGNYDWAVPEEWTDQARIRATVYDVDSMSSSDISAQFSIRGTEPPSIDITRPTGAETWMPGDEEEITWDSAEGNASIDSVDLEYSTDDGASWTVIDTGLTDNGSYYWTVPDVSSQEARIHATIHDVDGLTGEDVTDQFTIGDVVEEYTLSIDINGQGSTEPAAGDHSYQQGEEVTVTAMPDEGWEFDEWTGDYEGSSEEITITMDSDKSITAVFKELVEYDLTINIEGQGSTDPAEGTQKNKEGTVVTVEATPSEGWKFVEWTGDHPAGESESKKINITMDENKSVTAHFEEEVTYYELVTTVEGEGAVELTPDQAEYEEGTDVTLEAIPDENWEFVEWTGDYEGSSEEITITMDSDKEVTANFEEVVSYELTVNTEGEGSVDIEPDQSEYEERTNVTLTAMPDEGWYFDAWTGDHENGNRELTVIMDSDKTLTANFKEVVEDEYILTINSEGKGTTEPEPGDHAYEEGTNVTIEATPDQGWYFKEWTGDHEGTKAEITIKMDEDKEITASFAEIGDEENILTINIDGEGSTDPTEGTHTYEEGEEVTITATADEGWYFEEWTGTEETGEDITITMDEDKEVTAHFEEYEPANFEVEILSYNEDAKEGEKITVEYKVTNTGELEDTQDIELYLGEEKVDVYKDLTLKSGEEYKGEFALNADDVGEHELEVRSSDDTSAGMMTIEEESFLSNYWWLLPLLLLGIIIAIVLIFVMRGEDEEEEEPASPPPPTSGPGQMGESTEQGEWIKEESMEEPMEEESMEEPMEEEAMEEEPMEEEAVDEEPVEEEPIEE